MRKLIKKGTTEEEPAPQHSIQRDIANSKRATNKGETNIICLETVDKQLNYKTFFVKIRVEPPLDWLSHYIPSNKFHLVKQQN